MAVIILEKYKDQPAINIEPKQTKQIVTVETFFSKTNIINRPITCIGPIDEATKIAKPLEKPLSNKIGRIWLKIIPWLNANKVKVIPINQKDNFDKDPSAVNICNEVLGAFILDCCFACWVL